MLVRLRRLFKLTETTQMLSLTEYDETAGEVMLRRKFITKWAACLINRWDFFSRLDAPPL